MPGREFNAGDYRYGFNGKENDQETIGTGEGTQDYGFRIYNPALGRFLSVDPMYQEFAWNSTYAFAENKPINCIDLEGLEQYASYLAVLRTRSKLKNTVAGSGKILFGMLGTVGSVVYIGGTEGLGAAAGGATMLSLSLGEMAIGSAQITEAWSSNKNIDETPIAKSGSIPGFIAYSSNVDPLTAALVDGVGQVAAGGNPAKALYDAPKDLYNASNNGTLAKEAFDVYDNYNDNYGLVDAAVTKLDDKIMPKTINPATIPNVGPKASSTDKGPSQKAESKPSTYKGPGSGFMNHSKQKAESGKR